VSDLEIDAEAVRAAAQGLRNAASRIQPMAPVDASGCGSGSVIGAVEEFNMWARVTLTTLRSKLESQAQEADAAVTAYEQADAGIAADAGGQP